MKLIFNRKKYDSSSDLFQKAKWIPITQLLHLNIICFTWSIWTGDMHSHLRHTIFGVDFTPFKPRQRVPVRHGIALEGKSLQYICPIYLNHTLNQIDEEIADLRGQEFRSKVKALIYNEEFNFPKIKGFLGN